MKISKGFYARDARVVAKDLLGKVIVHKVDGIELKGEIVETEAYIGNIDKACHAYGGKMTPKIKPLYGTPGIAYVYFIYGKYFCFNIITKKAGEAEGVLIRAVEPIEGLEKMSYLRFGKSFNEITKVQSRNLTSGPSKFCMAFNINKTNNEQELYNGCLYIEEKTVKENFEIVEAKRIGIDYAKEAKNFLWRYYINNNKWVSVNKK